MSLGISKREGETWRECAERYAKPWGLEAEVLEIFDYEVARGVSEDRAAWNGCYEWDVCELLDAASSQPVSAAAPPTSDKE